MDQPERRDTGALAQDSPALFRAINRLFSPIEADLMARLYSCAAQAGGLAEGPIVRAPMASFNPRPARLCKILLRECEERDIQVLAAALLLGAPSLAVPPTAGEAFNLVEEYQKFRVGALRTQPSLKLERIHLAVLLDDLRHLHMTKLPIAQQESIVEDFESMYRNGAYNAENVPLLRSVMSAARRVRINLLSEDSV